MNDATWFNNPAITSELLPALGETLAMTAWATVISVALGLPLGIWLFVTTPHSLAPNRTVHQIVSTIVDIGRSIPFIVLIVAIIPFTRLLVGTALGWKAAVVALTLSAIPFYARLVENALHEVSAGKIEAAPAAGRSSVRFLCAKRFPGSSEQPPSPLSRW